MLWRANRAGPPAEPLCRGLIDSKPGCRSASIATRAYALRGETATRSAPFGVLLGSDAILRFLPVPAPSAETASGAPARVHSVAFSRDGSLFQAAAGSAGFLLYSLPSGRSLAERRPRSAKDPPSYTPSPLAPTERTPWLLARAGRSSCCRCAIPKRPEVVISTSARAVQPGLQP